ncbi:MAG: DUF1801 domain-containing protein [Acidobacteria bacterium]|nr:DUF1801 domain-containing protein [Acidobacteriota bacterium]
MKQAAKVGREAAAKVKADVREYLASLTPDARKALRAVRSAVRAAVPAATEHFSYGVPGFRLDGQPLIWYAAFARHFSLYPMGTAIRQKHAAALKGFGTATGTIRFPLADPVPLALVAKLVRARAVEARAEAKKKLAR